MTSSLCCRRLDNPQTVFVSLIRCAGNFSAKSKLNMENEMVNSRNCSEYSLTSVTTSTRKEDREKNSELRKKRGTSIWRVFWISDWLQATIYAYENGVGTRTRYHPLVIVVSRRLEYSYASSFNSRDSSIVTEGPSLASTWASIRGSITDLPSQFDALRSSCTCANTEGAFVNPIMLPSPRR